MDIQYNRKEDYKTIILPNSNMNADNSESHLLSNTNTVKVNGNGQTEPNTTAATTSEQQVLNGTTNKPNATLLLNDEKEIETTVIFVHYDWSLMPNSIEYQKTVEAYTNFIDNPPQAPAPTTHDDDATNDATR